MAHIKAIIFDLDNVLYDERDYIFAAFHSIALFLSKRCQLPKNMIYSKLVCDLEKKGSMYPRLFNEIINDLGLKQILVQDILKLYATLDSKVELYPEVKSTLLTLRHLGLKLALVTNGGIQIQRNKIRLLRVEELFDTIVYARETRFGKEKPHPEAFSAALNYLSVGADEALCVGDNPHTDFWGPKQMGMRTVRIFCGEFKDVHLRAEYEAEIALLNVAEILKVVERLNC